MARRKYVGAIDPKWRLALRVVPIAAVVVLAKVVVDRLGWEQLSPNPLQGSLVAATVFLFGFLLAGTLTDFKESERLPGELAVSLEAIADECLILYEGKRAAEARDCLAHVRDLAVSLRRWFFDREKTDAVLGAITGFNSFFLAFELLTQPNFIVRLKQEQSALRRVVTRIHMIRETSFVAAGYAIAELATLFLLVILILTGIGSLGEELALVSVIAFVLVYMALLIRNLDDPFDYASESGVAGVSLHPLDHVDERRPRERLSGAGEVDSLTLIDTKAMVSSSSCL